VHNDCTSSELRKCSARRRVVEIDGKRGYVRACSGRGSQGIAMPPPGNDDLIAACERQLLRDAGAGETGANDDPARNRFHHN